MKHFTLKIIMLCTLYYCFVYPYLNYCVEVWGDTFKTYLQALVKLQKKVLRMISYSKWNASVDHLYKYHNIMQLKKIYSCTSYVSSEDLICTVCIPGTFHKNRNVHDYFTRQHDKFHVPNAKRNYMQRTISYRGVIVWNHITSKHITHDRSLLSFKFALRKYVFDDDTLLDSV